MRNFLVLAAGCLGALAPGPGRASSPDGRLSLPKEAMTTVQRALELTGAAFPSPGENLSFAEKVDKIHQAGRQFGAVLDQLAGQVDETLGAQLAAAEGRDIETKLVLIAWDRKKRPKVYQELKAAYFRAPRDTGKIVAAARAVDKVHAAEPYRLAWEYCLLRPDAEPFPHCPQARAIEALTAIRNNASVVTLVHRYRVTCQEGVPSRLVDTQQTLLLVGLSEFRAEAGLRGLLDCAALSRKQQSKEGKDKSYWDAEGFVHDVLTDRLNRGTRPEWLKIIAAFPRDGLTLEQRQLLEKAGREK